MNQHWFDPSLVKERFPLTCAFAEAHPHLELTIFSDAEVWFEISYTNGRLRPTNRLIYFDEKERDKRLYKYPEEDDRMVVFLRTNMLGWDERAG